jgi:hypothetical protein
MIQDSGYQVPDTGCPDSGFRIQDSESGIHTTQSTLCVGTESNRIPHPVSSFQFRTSIRNPESWILYPVSCIQFRLPVRRYTGRFKMFYPASFILILASWILYPESCILHHASCILDLGSCILNRLSPVARPASPIRIYRPGGAYTETPSAWYL